MNDVDFRKTMRNVRKQTDIKLVTTEARRNYLFTEPNFENKQIKEKLENLLAVEMKKILIHKC